MIWIFREMTSGTMLFQCSWFDIGYMFLPVYEVMGVSHIFFVNANSDPEGKTGLHSEANCAADREDLTGPVLGLVVDAPVVVQRQVPWFRQCRIPWSFRSCRLVNRWPMSLLCWFAVAVHRQGLHCLMVDFAAFCCFFQTPSVWT